MKPISVVVLIILSLCLSYLAYAFYNAEFNAAMWEPEQRGFMLLTGAVLAYVLGGFEMFKAR